MPVYEVVLLIAVLSAGGFVQSLSGFGYALFTTPIVSAMIAPSRAVVLIAIANLFSSMRNTYMGRDEISWKPARNMTAAAVVGMPLGLIVLEKVGANPLRLVIGVVVALIATSIALGIEMRRGSTGLDLAAGFVSGVLNTSTGTNGPAIVIGLRPHRLPVRAFKSTTGVVFTISGSIGIALFAARHLVRVHDVWIALAAVPVQIATARVGDRVVRRLSTRRFDGLVLLLLFTSAAAAIITAIVRLAR